MTSPSPSAPDLIGLALRVEAAEANEQERLIAEAAARIFSPGDAAYLPAFKLIAAGAFLDAAMSLVPEGMLWNIGNDAGSWAHLWEPWSGSDVFGGKAATPALALCAAALHARSQEQ